MRTWIVALLVSCVSIAQAQKVTFDFPWRPGLEPAGKVMALNSMIKKFSEENDVFYLDYFPALADSRNGMKKDYSGDEVHPTLEGYKVMEPMVEKAIATVLKKK